MSDYGLVQAVIVDPQGSTLVADATAGDTELVVEDGQDFDDQGGTLDLNGARIQYTSIIEGTNPDDPDTINLAGPLAADASEDDAVAPVVGGQIPEDWYAVVSMGEEGEPAHIPIDVDQRPQWQVGDYVDPVPVRISDDLQHIEDAPGRTVLPSSTAPTLARLAIYSEIFAADFAALGLTPGATGVIDLPAWNPPDEIVGTAFDHSVPNVLSVLESGVYAVTSTIRCEGIEAADVATSLRLLVNMETQNPYIDCGLRGGDSEGGGALGVHPSATASYTYYIDSKSANDISYQLAFTNFDATNIDKIQIGVGVQQIVPASTPTTDPPSEHIPTELTGLVLEWDSVGTWVDGGGAVVGTDPLGDSDPATYVNAFTLTPPNNNTHLVSGGGNLIDLSNGSNNYPTVARTYILPRLAAADIWFKTGSTITLDVEFDYTLLSPDYVGTDTGSVNAEDITCTTEATYANANQSGSGVPALHIQNFTIPDDSNLAIHVNTPESYTWSQNRDAGFGAVELVSRIRAGEAIFYVPWPLVIAAAGDAFQDRIRTTTLRIHKLKITISGVWDADPN